MNNLSRTDREAVISSVVQTVERKHFDPQFDKERWRSAIDRQRSGLIETLDENQFSALMNDLVRSFGTADAGFFHENTRKKMPKRLTARLQYCQPNECASGFN